MAVATYAQHLGTLLLKSGISLIEGGSLVSSTACEIEDVKGKNNCLLAFELAERETLAVLVY